MAQVIKKRFFKVVFWAIASLLILLVALTSAIQIPYIQTKLVQKSTNIITSRTGFPSEIEYVNINWFDQMAIRGLKIYDDQDSLMIAAEEALVDFEIATLFNNAARSIDAIKLFNAKVVVRKNAADSTVNITRFVKNLRSSFAKPGEGKAAFAIGEVKLFEASFSYVDPRKDSIFNGFDYHHFTVEKIKAEVSSFTVNSDTVAFKVDKLSGSDQKTGLQVTRLNTYFSISQREMKFKGLDLEVGKSHIKDSVTFHFNGSQNLSYFNDSVDVTAGFRESIIDSQDLALFAPTLRRYNEVYLFSGNFKGKVTDFRIRNMDFRFGSRSSLRGSLEIAGLPNVAESFIIADLRNSNVLTEDLQPYLSEKSYSRLSKLGRLDFTGNIIGFPNDFVAQGSINTSLGRLISDVNLKLDRDPSQTTYKGVVTTEDFDLGEYTGNKKAFQKVSLSGSLEGKGFTLEEANFSLEGEIESIGVNGYDYSNIRTNAQFAKEFFDGSIAINDPNLKFDAIGSIDFRERKNLVNVKGTLDTAFLKRINVLKEDIFLRTELDLNVTGLHIDSILGSANLRNTLMLYEDRNLSVGSLEVVSGKSGDGRSLHIESNNVEININGTYDYSVAYKKLKELYVEYLLKITNDADSIQSYYANKVPDYENRFNFSYDIDLRNINPLLNLFEPEAYVSKNTTIDGMVIGGYTSILSLNSSIDTVVYHGNAFFDNEIELSSSKVQDSTDILSLGFIYSRAQEFEISTDTKNLILEATWDNNHVDFNFNIEQEGLDNYADIDGELNFLRDETQIRILPSDVQALNEKWKIGEGNMISLIDKEVLFRNLQISNDEQSIGLEGAISSDINKSLTLSVRQLQLENLNPILRRDISGMAEGFVRLSGAFGETRIESQFDINELAIEQFGIGDITALSKWDNLQKRFDLEFFLDRERARLVDVQGTFTPGASDNSLDLKASLKKANLSIVEPFISNYFSDIDGSATGEFTIQGTPARLILGGTGEINEGAIKVDYLNTTYTFNSGLFLNENSVLFNNLELMDKNLNKATLNGGFFHEGFKNTAINAKGSLDNFLVLNTTAADNDLFYGTGLVTGTIDFLGSINNMNISAEATTNRGTRVFIPIGGTESIEQEDFINFVSFTDSTTTATVEEDDKVDLRGLNLDFDLDITPDAYAEIIFDIKAGDIIRGRGNGKLKLQIDTQGEFNMFGDYEFEEGGYNFTLYNIINKEFEILPKSSISWAGDPYQGLLNIDATYRQLASMSPLFSSTDSAFYSHPDVQRRYPTQVILDLNGPLLTPTIDFDIEISDYPENITVGSNTISLETTVAALKSRLESNEQELKRQVFSLVILRRFSPEDEPFRASGSFGNSVSEFISNQLSYWITQVDENLEIDVDLGNLDDEAFNTFQLRLSYTFLDGRLRVTRDGGFTNQDRQADVSSIAGDWTVEYLLTEDGKLRVKMYNRTNFNTLTGLENETTTTAGVSLLHTQSFDEIKDLFRRVRKKKNSQPTKEVVPTAAITEEKKSHQ